MPTKTKTAYFTPELFKFLRQLKRNNNRDWFEKNKPRFVEHVQQPMLHFIADFGARLERISSHFVADPRPNGGSMFRIYRDTRFSKDKTPYKTAATAQFRHEDAKDVHCPGFYLHLGLDGVFGSTGIWRPDGPTIKKIRDAIVADPTAWTKLSRAKAFKDRMQWFEGESLKRPPRGYDPEHPLVEDLKRKDFCTMTSFGEKAACGPGFLDEYVAMCRAGRPFVKYLCEAVGVGW